MSLDPTIEHLEKIDAAASKVFSTNNHITAMVEYSVEVPWAIRIWEEDIYREYAAFVLANEKLAKALALDGFVLLATGEEAFIDGNAWVSYWSVVPISEHVFVGAPHSAYEQCKCGLKRYMSRDGEFVYSNSEHLNIRDIPLCVEGPAV